jgi:hypothetical protein
MKGIREPQIDTAGKEKCLTGLLKELVLRLMLLVEKEIRSNRFCFNSTAETCVLLPPADMIL